MFWLIGTAPKVVKFEPAYICYKGILNALLWLSKREANQERESAELSANSVDTKETILSGGFYAGSRRSLKQLSAAFKQKIQLYRHRR